MWRLLAQLLLMLGVLCDVPGCEDAVRHEFALQAETALRGCWIVTAIARDGIPVPEKEFEGEQWTITRGSDVLFERSEGRPVRSTELMEALFGNDPKPSFEVKLPSVTAVVVSWFSVIWRIAPFELAGQG